MDRASARGDPVRWRCRLVLALCWLTLLLLAPAARAQEAARVVLVTGEHPGATATRIQAELNQLGVEVVLVASSQAEPVGRAPLEQTARSASLGKGQRLMGRRSPALMPRARASSTAPWRIRLTTP